VGEGIGVFSGWGFGVVYSGPLAYYLIDLRTYTGSVGTVTFYQDEEELKPARCADWFAFGGSCTFRYGDLNCDFVDKDGWMMRKTVLLKGVGAIQDLGDVIGEGMLDENTTTCAFATNYATQQWFADVLVKQDQGVSVARADAAISIDPTRNIRTAGTESLNWLSDGSCNKAQCCCVTSVLPFAQSSQTPHFSMTATVAGVCGSSSSVPTFSAGFDWSTPHTATANTATISGRVSGVGSVSIVFGSSYENAAFQFAMQPQSQCASGLYLSPCAVGQVEVNGQCTTPSGGSVSVATAVLRGPTSVGYCNSLVLDGTQSGGFAPPATYLWSLESTNPADTTVQPYADALRTTFSQSTTKSSIPLDADDLLPGYCFTFALRVQARNADGLYVTSAASILQTCKSAAVAPDVVVSAPPGTLYRNTEVRVKGKVTSSTCFDANRPWQYAWARVSGPSLSASVTTLLSAAKTAELVLPANSLSVGTYTLRLTATASGVVATGTSTFTITASPIIVDVPGGNRLVSPSNPVSFTPTTDDPDSSDDDLTYTWTCTYDHDNNANTPNVDCGIPLPTTPDTGELNVQEDTLQPGNTYIFTLTVTDVDTGRQTITTVQISTASAAGAPVFDVFLNLVSYGNVQTSGTISWNPDSTFRLSSALGDRDLDGETDEWDLDSFTFEWSQSIDGGDLLSLTDQSTPYLILPSRYMEGGSLYVFQLDATDTTSGETGRAWINVYAALGPKSDAVPPFTVGPITGAGGQTVFTLTAIDWYDPASLVSPTDPLKYKFAFVDPDTGRVTALTDFIYDITAPVYLAPPPLPTSTDGDSTYTLELVLIAYTGSGASSNASTFVDVTLPDGLVGIDPSKPSDGQLECFVYNMSVTALQAAASTQANSQLLQLSKIMSSLLNLGTEETRNAVSDVSVSCPVPHTPYNWDENSTVALEPFVATIPDLHMWLREQLLNVIAGIANNNIASPTTAGAEQVTQSLSDLTAVPQETNSTEFFDTTLDVLLSCLGSLTSDAFYQYPSEESGESASQSAVDTLSNLADNSDCSQINQIRSNAKQWPAASMKSALPGERNDKVSRSKTPPRTKPAAPHTSSTKSAKGKATPASVTSNAAPTSGKLRVSRARVSPGQNANAFVNPTSGKGTKAVGKTSSAGSTDKGSKKGVRSSQYTIPGSALPSNVPPKSKKSFDVSIVEISGMDFGTCNEWTSDNSDGILESPLSDLSDIVVSISDDSDLADLCGGQEPTSANDQNCDGRDDDLGEAAVKINGLDQPVVYTMPLVEDFLGQTVCGVNDIGSIDLSVPTCQFWDTVSNGWSTEGCVTIGLSDDLSEVMCQCNHLTEFAIYAQQISKGCGGDTDPMYVTFMVFYWCVFIAAAVQLCRIHRYSAKLNWKSMVVVEHVCVLAVTFFRALLTMFYSNAGSLDIARTPIGAIGFLTAMALTLEFGAFTFLVSQWCAVYHFSLSTPSNPFQRLRIPFVIVNCILAGLVVLGIILIGAFAGDKDMQQDIAMGFEITTGCITLLISAAFAIYSTLLVRFMGKASSPGTSNKRKDLQNKMLAGGAAFAVIFFVESLLSIISASLSSPSEAVIVLYLLFNLAGLCALLILFANGVNELRKKDLGTTRERDSSTGRATDAELVRKASESGKGTSSSGHKKSMSTADEDAQEV